ncbi:hypothetical protein HY496_02600 [Candidatus Woesearchaeota archaeon]|nr:hypothetical protein [Candidatus Woesearchaeota archaeon]
MKPINAGDIKYYHESGDVYRVKVQEVSVKNYGNATGKEYRLEIVDVVSTSASNPPSSGLEFTVWKADDAGGYGGWHLLDR